MCQSSLALCIGSPDGVEHCYDVHAGPELQGVEAPLLANILCVGLLLMSVELEAVLIQSQRQSCACRGAEFNYLGKARPCFLP